MRDFYGLQAFAQSIYVPLMLMRDMNQSLGLCNGTHLLQGFERVFEGEFITGTNKGQPIIGFMQWDTFITYKDLREREREYLKEKSLQGLMKASVFAFLRLF